MPSPVNLLDPALPLFEACPGRTASMFLIGSSGRSERQSSRRGSLAPQALIVAASDTPMTSLHARPFPGHSPVLKAPHQYTRREVAKGEGREHGAHGGARRTRRWVMGCFIGSREAAKGRREEEGTRRDTEGHGGHGGHGEGLWAPSLAHAKPRSREGNEGAPPGRRRVNPAATGREAGYGK